MQQSVEVVVSISKNLDQVSWRQACDTRALDNNTINWFYGKWHKQQHLLMPRESALLSAVNNDLTDEASRFFPQYLIFF